MLPLLRTPGTLRTLTLCSPSVRSSPLSCTRLCEASSTLPSGACTLPCKCWCCGWPGADGEGMAWGRFVVGMRSQRGPAGHLGSSCVRGRAPGFLSAVSRDGHTWREMGQQADRWVPTSLGIEHEVSSPARVSAPVELILASGLPLSRVLGLPLAAHRKGRGGLWLPRAEC